MATDNLSASEKLDPSVWKISTVAMFGTLLAQLDATIVNVSLSSLSANLHASLSTIQWVTSGYLLALTLTHTSETCSACGALDAASRVARARFVCSTCGGDFDAASTRRGTSSP